MGYCEAVKNGVLPMDLTMETVRDVKWKRIRNMLWSQYTVLGTTGNRCMDVKMPRREATKKSMWHSNSVRGVFVVLNIFDFPRGKTCLCECVCDLPMCCKRVSRCSFCRRPCHPASMS